jgi:subtilase family serine protease
VIVGGVGVLLIAAAVTVPALASASKKAETPAEQRIAATTATYNAIEAKVAAGKSLDLGYPDPTAATDILDYGVNDLWKKGIDGEGVTVAYIVTNPDPNIATSMANYDKAMDLPAAHITQMAIPAATGSHVTCTVECDTGEDELDAEAIHSMAPDANILFVHPSVPETIGMQGWPQVAQAIKTIADKHLANLITVSMGDGEADFKNDPTNPGSSESAAVHSLDPAFLDAAANGIPVDVSAGDCGPTDPTVLNDTGQCTPTTGVTADHPGDSPWVTSVGGTIPNAGVSTKTGRTAPDGLWTANGDTDDAGGGGVSTLYAKPSWQDGIAALDNVKGRAYPDISMDADDGTSQASPTFTGILALATQLKGGSLGTVNPALAAIGPKGAADGIIDVPAGYTDSAYGVTGYRTATGYDIASGWGTIYAPNFVPALVKEIDSQHGAPARTAQEDLDGLRSGISVSASGSAEKVTGRGYIPGRTPNGTSVRDGFGVYPALQGEYGVPSTGPWADPASRVPGQNWDTVTATLAGPGSPSKPGAVKPVAVTGPDGNGDVTLSIGTSGLKPGKYTVTITGDVLTQAATFTVR